MQQKPKLIIIAGPNGAGKTTITEQLRKYHWLDNTTYINPDIIAQEKFGGWNNKKSFIKAANYAQKTRENCIKNKQNLVFETVFSTQEKVDFIEKAINNDYFVRLFFIATDNPLINTNRIIKRINEGGHKVPFNKIVSRHFKSIKNCQKIINIVDRIYIYDNSIDNIPPKLIFRIANKKEKIVKQYEKLNDWTKIIFNKII